MDKENRKKRSKRNAEPELTSNKATVRRRKGKGADDPRRDAIDEESGVESCYFRKA